MLDQFEITIPQLTGDEPRNVYIYKPRGKGPFPVLYMFDGQNLFHDEDATFGKSWGILDYFEKNRIPMIVAACECNHHPEDDPFGRLSEYSPFDFDDRWHGSITGRGKITMDWFVKEFKPYVDDNYPTRKGRRNTFIAGSSMGGLMTLYALSRYSRVFSKGAALSPSIGFSYGAVKNMIAESPMNHTTTLYMDYGEREIKYRNTVSQYAEITKLLIKKGVNVTSRIVPRGEHNEATWEKQVPLFVGVLLYEV